MTIALTYVRMIAETNHPDFPGLKTIRTMRNGFELDLRLTRLGGIHRAHFRLHGESDGVRLDRTVDIELNAVDVSLYKEHKFFDDALVHKLLLSMADVNAYDDVKVLSCFNQFIIAIKDDDGELIVCRTTIPTGRNMTQLALDVSNVQYFRSWNALASADIDGEFLHLVSVAGDTQSVRLVETPDIDYATFGYITGTIPAEGLIYQIAKDCDEDIFATRPPGVALMDFDEIRVRILSQKRSIAEAVVNCFEVMNNLDLSPHIQVEIRQEVTVIAAEVSKDTDRNDRSYCNALERINDITGWLRSWPVKFGRQIKTG